MADTLKTRLDKIRTLKSRGADSEVQAMFELLALEKRSVLWRTSETTKFKDILREDANGLCTPARFTAFKRADNYFSRKAIENLGIECVCVIANQPKGKRDRMIKDATTFKRERGVVPTYQYFAKHLRRSSSPGPTRKQLIKYNDKLKAEIKALGGRVPPMDM